ncbi:hypothetical protein MHYP_G00302780 [Metynnis hypsauchen]
MCKIRKSVFSVVVALHRGSSDSGVFGLAAGEPRPVRAAAPSAPGPLAGLLRQGTPARGAPDTAPIQAGRSPG